MFGLKTKSPAQPKLPSLVEQMLIIQQIHKDFYNQQAIVKDEFPILAEKCLKEYHESQTMTKKYETLKSLGFTNSKSFKDLEASQKLGNQLWSQYKLLEQDIQARKYFNEKYPNNKFITKNQVGKLCAKYGFVCGPTTAFIGEIPENNLLEMTSLKLEDEDIIVQSSSGSVYGSLRYFKGRTYGFSGEVAKLEIVALLKDFDTRNLEQNQYFLTEVVKPQVNDDPIVLQPVHFANSKYYLILTAWGPEAEDPLVKL